VVGGPKGALSHGILHYSEGKSTRQWPFRAGSELLGAYCHEYTHTKKGGRLFYNGTDIAFVCTHAWQWREGQWRYLGKFNGTDEAKGRIEMVRQRLASDVPVQPVAPASRLRRKV